MTTAIRVGAYHVHRQHSKVTVTSEASFTGSMQLGVGQIVCTVAKATSLLDQTIGPDDVDVTIVTSHRTLGPHQCSQFLVP